MCLVVLDLPEVIVSEILCRLPVEDVKSCRCVCRTWYDVIKEPQFFYAQQRRGIKHPSYILLQTDLDTEKGKIKNATYMIKESRTDNNWIPKEIQVCGTNLEDARVVGSSNGGLLCLVSSGTGTERSMFVYNLILKDGLRLPNPHQGLKKNLTCFGIGFDEVTKSYKVVLANTMWSKDDGVYRTYGEILTVGDNAWRDLHFPHLILPQRLKPVFFKDAFIWLFYLKNNLCDVDNMILALNVNIEKFEIVKFPSPEEILDITKNKYILQKYPNYPVSKSEDLSHMKLMRLGKSLALVSDKSSCTGISAIGILQTVGNESDSRKIYRCNLIAFVDYNTNKSCEMLAMLSDGSFLTRTSNCITGAHCITRCIPEDREIHTLDLPGVPTKSESFLLVPRFIAPSTLNSS